MFYTPYVDISSPKSMWTFLHDHFTYSTLNSWNGLKSIANNVKLHRLKLEGDWCTALKFLNDSNDIGDLQYIIQECIDEFVANHSMFRVYFNGRSGGYLVLYNKDNNKNVLPDCVTDYDSYEEFKEDIKSYGARVSDYTATLRAYTHLVREFDKLCDNLRDIVNEYSKMSYEDQLLAQTVERFNDLYYLDLERLCIEPLQVLDGSVDISSLTLSCLVEALMRMFGVEGYRVEIKDTKLIVKEN